MNHLLEVDSVILEFSERKILQDIYLPCETGQVTALLGRNGSGKSSLFNVIFGELNPSGCSVRIDGVNRMPHFFSPSDLVYLTQNNFIPKSLKFKRVLHDYQVELDELCTYFPEFKNKSSFRMSAFSSGERRLIELFIIFRSKAKFCILDEPFSQIMPLHVETIQKMINSAKHTKGILITDHLVQEVIDVSDRIYFLENGKTNLVNNQKNLERFGY